MPFSCRSFFFFFFSSRRRHTRCQSVTGVQTCALPIFTVSIESAMTAQWYDANISIPGCDKNMPGCIMAMGRLNRPSLMVYGGTIRAGTLDGQKLDIISAFQSYGEFLSGRIDENKRKEIIRHSCP